MHYPDTAPPVNSTAGDAPLMVFCDKRAEEAHITVGEVGAGEGGANMEELTLMELFKFHIDVSFVPDVQGISRDLTSALQKLTYLDTSELLAHMASLHAINAACYLDSFDAYTSSKSAPIAALARPTMAVVSL